jgi:phenol hydroxylase P5 protein
VWLPHACTHGTCGTCKVQVLDGDLDLGDASPYALLDSEREEGAALICVAKPNSDVTIEGEVEVEDGVEIHPVRDYTGTVTELIEVAPGVRRLRLTLTEPIPFNAGQYVQLRTPDGQTRPYSLAGPPRDASTIELHVKRSEDGAATAGWIFADLAVGDEVPVSGPYGQFSFRPARDEPVLLLAGGTGLAPMKSILQHIDHTDSGHEVVLYHGVPTAEDLYEHDWLQEFADTHDWFTYRPALSREEYEGRTGRVPALLAEDYPRAAGNVAYICGSPEFVADTMKALMKARLFPRDIYREDFFDSADRASGTNVVRSPLIRR